MVTRVPAEPTGATSVNGGPSGQAGLVFTIDGSRPLEASAITALTALCDQAEDRANRSPAILRVSGALCPGSAPGARPGSPAGPPPVVTVALVGRWERALRRLERLPVATIAVAAGDCGGLALDALLAADYRIGSASVRLMVPFEAGAAWPGMALYRLAHQAGAAAIRRAVLFGVPIESADALAMHLVDELAADQATALAAAVRIAGGCQGTELAIRRRLILDAGSASFEDALGAHLAACDRALRQGAAGRPGTGP